MVDKLGQEAIELLKIHRDRFHGKDPKKCVICRSLSRTFVRAAGRIMGEEVKK